MKFLGKEIFQKQSASVGQKSMALGMSDALGSFMMLGSSAQASTAASALNLYRKSSAVAIPINRITTAIAGMKFVLEMEDGTIINDHKVLDLIRKPSPYFTRSLFIETITKNFLITGELYVVGIGSISSAPVELQPISPDKITITEGYDGAANAMLVTGETMAGSYPSVRNGREIRYLRDNLSEIHQTRMYKTRNNSLLRGESLLVSASSEVSQHILGGIHNVSLLEKGGRVSLVFHFEEDMSPDDFETTKERVREQYGGASKAGEIGVTAGDGSLDIKEIGSKNKDMDFALLQKMAKVSIANQYGFPLILLDTDAATFNNYDAAKEALYDDAALPIANVIMGGLSDFLLPRFNEDPTKMRIVPDMDSIPALQMRRNKELKARKEIGVETVNELRDMLPNRLDVEGGDKVLIPANLITLDNVDTDFDNPPSLEFDDGKVEKD